MKQNRSDLEISLLRRILYAPAHREREAGPLVARPSIVVGRVVRSPKYGKGFIAEIDGGTLKVRFWKHGYVEFNEPEGDCPFELLDIVREVKEQSLVEKVLARETDTEKKERSRRCQHRENRHLCLKCAGLAEGEIKKWNPHRTKEQHIYRMSTLCRSGAKSHSVVTISQKDCDLVSRPANTVSTNKISHWYQCLRCEHITEVAAMKDKLTLCPTCGGPITSIPEPFQRGQFSPFIGNGATEEDYGGAASHIRMRHTEEEEIEVAMRLDLFTDPNSRVQRGGTGYLRMPLDAPRSTRADAPEWFDCRESFLQSFRKSRSERAERILNGFYVEEKTDEQIAEELGWTKDAIKKERKQLLGKGNDFFRLLAAKHPPMRTAEQE